MDIPIYSKNMEIAKEERFKVGDTVKIRCEDEMLFLYRHDIGEERGSGTHAFVARKMVDYAGEISKIVSVKKDALFGTVSYKLSVDKRKFNWDNYMLEPEKVEEENKTYEIPDFFNSPDLSKKKIFKPGDIVTICSKEELESLEKTTGKYDKYGREERGSLYHINSEMMDLHGKKAKILKVEVNDYYGKEVIYRIDLDRKEWCWSCYMFKETRYLEQKQWDKDKKEKSGTEKKRQVKRVEKKEPEIKTVLIEPVHVKEISVYDYKNQKSHFEIPEGKYITKIEVTVVTGDETGLVFFSDGSVMQFDSCDYRTYNYFDGSYTVTADNLEKWMNFSPNDFDRKSKNFSVQRMEFAATLL